MRPNRSISAGASQFYPSGWTARSQTQSAHGKRPTQMFTFQKKRKICVDDFQPIRSLGEGAFGEVLLARLKSTKQEFAMKVLDKDHIQKMQQEKQVLVEKQALSKLNHPNFVKLHYSFQDDGYLYMVMDFIRNSDLKQMLKLMKKLEPKTVRFYAAEIVNMLVYLRDLKIVHRDLKPDNLLLDDNYHLKLTDFGTAKFDDRKSPSPSVLSKDSEGSQEKISEDPDFTRSNFVGSKDYVSPEVLKDLKSSFSADLWALGCIIYELSTGVPIFKAPTEFLTFQLILKGEMQFPKDMDPACQDLIERLVVLTPEERLGAGGEAGDLDALMMHPYFKGIDFQDLHKSKVPFSQAFLKEWRRKQEQEDSEEEKGAFQGDRFQDNSVYVHQKADEIIKANRVVKDGIVIKKCGWFFWKRRYLKLTEKPTLAYYDPNKNEFKVSSKSE